MKKLMIAAAIVCAAAMSQAAALQWKWTSTLTDQPNGAAYNGTVFLVNALSYSQQDIIDNVLKGTGSLSSYAMESTGISTTNGKAPTAAQVISSDSSTVAMRTDDVSGKKYFDYFYAALTTDEDGKKWLFLGDKKSTQYQTADTTTLTQSLSSSKTLYKDTETFSSQGWYSAAAVPEPTSGLLLLLGVAGLALRRRRA